MKCSLCKNTADFLTRQRHGNYYQCCSCGSAFLDPAFFLSPAQEKERYATHENDVEDLRYQNFVRPIVDAVTKHFLPSHEGLDFGSGTGPVITKLLKDAGYQVQKYDPLFFNDTQALHKQYNYIACCEVIEHFHQPLKEFTLLHSLLRPGGKLYCMSELFYDEIEFEKWYYKNDPTHVFFYHPQAIAWIKNTLGFSSVKIQGRLIEFTR